MIDLCYGFSLFFINSFMLYIFYDHLIFLLNTISWQCFHFGVENSFNLLNVCSIFYGRDVMSRFVCLFVCVFSGFDHFPIDRK